MTFTYIGWLNGISGLCVFAFSILFGVFFVIESHKRNSNLILYLGLTYIFGGLAFTGDILDFFTILLTETNIDNSFGIIGLISWIWFPAAVLFALYLGAILLTPNIKWYIFSIYLGLGIIFELFLIIDLKGSVTYDVPSDLGSDLINDHLVFTSIPGIFAVIFFISLLVFLGFGFLRKGLQSGGIIRKRFFFMSLGTFMYIVGAILDGLFPLGIVLILTRFVMVFSAWFFYIGLKE